MSKQFFVYLDRPRLGKGCSKPVGQFIERGSHKYSTVEDIFGHVHYLGNHSVQWKKWQHAEKRLLNKYSPNLFKMVMLGIKKERL
jgi:hypothetical protein